MTAANIDSVVNLCVRRGLIFPSSDLHGSIAGFFDYGPYGVALKKRVQDAWWRWFVEQRQDVVGLDAAILSGEGVWKASGHLDAFNDPLVACKKCKKRFRADHLIKDELGLDVEGVSDEQLGALLKKHKLACPDCKSELAEAKKFNLMFESRAGSVEEETASRVFLRPETAQAIFTDFKQIQAVSRKKLPFGIAQVGKAFRNEISPRNFVFRSREFSMMELEFFTKPQDDSAPLEKKHLALKITVLTAEEQAKKGSKASEKTISDLLKDKTIASKWIAYWLAESVLFLNSLGLKNNLRLRQHVKTELSHYSSDTWDVEYDYPEWGWKELLGVADRGDFDLTQHAKHSGKDLTYFDEEAKQKIMPHVVEPSFGLDRLVFTLLVDAYSENKGEKGSSVVLKLDEAVAPIRVAVFPLMKKDGLAEKAREVFEMMRAAGIGVEYDEAGSIGKRYARMDEVGCPYCITVDYDSLEKSDVTVRFRDSGKQERVKTDELRKLFK
ncbi:MAG: glycine--tRNA ligase [Candidatus Micrarchaeota archaeon]